MEKYDPDDFDVERLLAKLPAGEERDRVGAITYLAKGGLRLTEIAALKADDVAFAAISGERQARVRVKSRRTGRDHAVFFGPKAAQALAAHLERCPLFEQSADKLWPATRGIPFMAFRHALAMRFGTKAPE